MNRFILITFLLVSTRLFSYEVVKDTSRLPPVVSSNIKTFKMKLDNGMEVYLISDPKAKKSSALLSVNVGSWEDPDKYPGLAHFVEHMLFMGTEKYPKEDSFTEFIKSHGGTTNAFTEDQYTSYVFDIQTSAFPEALERFSQFFISPLFKTAALEREVHAIEQEFEGKSLLNNARRLMIYKDLGNPKSPFSRFNFGSSTSLKGAGHKELKQWFDHYYSANLMRLVVESPLPIEKLASLVNKDFSPIINRHLGKITFPAPLFSSELKGKMLYVKPLKEERSLVLLWELPPKFAREEKSKPQELLCRVFGSEVKNSLLYNLRKKGLAIDMACGSTQWDEDHIVFMMELELTNKGVKNVDEVVGKIYQTLAAIKKEGMPRYIFDEINSIQMLNYKYPERTSAYQEVIQNAKNLREEPLSSYPEESTIIEKFEPKLVNQIIDHLTPQNMILDLMADPRSTGVKFNRVEKWMETPYTIKNIPLEWKSKWQDAKPLASFKLPPPNPYIPKNLSLINETKEKVFQGKRGRLYLMPDTSYNLPKISWTILIKTPAIDPTSPESLVLTDLLIEIVKKKLSPLSYEAKLAGLSYDLEQKSDGIKISLYGFSEKAHILLNDILMALKENDATNENFQTYKKAMEQTLANFFVKAPYLQGFDLVKQVIYKNFVSAIEKQEALDLLTFDRFKKFEKKLFEELYIEGILFGNNDEEQGKKVWDELMSLSKTPYPPSKQYVKDIAVFPENKGPYFLIDIIHTKGNAILLLIEDPEFSFKNYAAQEILAQMISTPFFKELRTKQQTAYLLGNLQQEIGKALFQVFVLESFSYDPRDLLSRIELFLEIFSASLSQNEEIRVKFQSIKNALIDKLKIPPESLRKKGQELAGLLLDHHGDFDWDKERIRGLQNLSFAEFVSYAKKLLGATNRRRLAVLVEGSKNNEILQYKEAKSVRWLQKNMKYVTDEAP